jgi:multicomponent K+:H+ antiporter subunit D
LLLLSPLLVVFAAPIIAFVDAAAVQVHDLALYRQLLTGGAQ